MATHELTLDVDKSVALAADLITARAGDTGTVIKADLLKDGVPLTGATGARFVALKPDHTYADQSATVSGCTATVTLDPKFLSAPGVIKTAYFRIEAGGRAETTPDIWINVLPDAESQSDGPTGPYVSEIESLIAQLNSIKSQMQGATASATSAAGKASSAAASASSAAASAEGAAGAANAATKAANTAAGTASAAAATASTAAGKAGDAAADAVAAAAEARAAAGMVSQDKMIFMEYETVGGVRYLTLTDKGDD